MEIVCVVQSAGVDHGDCLCAAACRSRSWRLFVCCSLQEQIMEIVCVLQDVEADHGNCSCAAAFRRIRSRRIFICVSLQEQVIEIVCCSLQEQIMEIVYWSMRWIMEIVCVLQPSGADHGNWKQQVEGGGTEG